MPREADLPAQIIRCLPTVHKSRAILSSAHCCRCRQGFLLTHTGGIGREMKPACHRDSMPSSGRPWTFSTALRSRIADMPVLKPVPWGTDFEVGQLRDVILCAPDHWGIDKNANAVVKAAVAKGVKFDLETAKRQHRNFVSALEREGIAIRWLPQLKCQISQTYTGEILSLTTPWGVVVCRMQAECRQDEYAAVIEFCRQHNVPIWKTVTEGTVEGGDVHVAKPRKLLIGHSGVRTTLNGAMQVLSWFEEKGWQGKLILYRTGFSASRSTFLHGRRRHRHHLHGGFLE